MSEQTQAASSPAEVADVFNGENLSFAEYDHHRKTGEVPERFKPAEPADPAPADAPEETVEPDAPDSDPEEAQEQPQKPVSPAEKRIKQLLAEKKELQRKLAAKPTQSDSSTAQAPRQPQNYQEWEQAFSPEQWIEEYAKANPSASYERANAAMFSFMQNARDHFKGIEQRVTAEKQALDAKVNEAKERYGEEFDEVKSTFLSKVIDGTKPLIPIPVLSLINDSENLADLIFVIGSDEAELAKFVEMAKTNPNKAIRYVAKIESGIAEELAKPKAARAEDGKFTAPEKRQTAAPKPPSPVGGGSSRAFDVSDESLSPEEWMRKRNAQLSKKG